MNNKSTQIISSIVSSDKKEKILLPYIMGDLTKIDLLEALGTANLSPLLIICPVIVVKDWERIAPEIIENPEFVVEVFSYGKAIRQSEYLLSKNWSSMIFHTNKKIQKSPSQNLTPIVNQLSEKTGKTILLTNDWSVYG